MAKKRGGAGRGRGRPTRKGKKSLNVKLKPGLKEALDAHVEKQRPYIGITALIEFLIEEHLIKSGDWPLPNDEAPSGETA